MRFISRSSSSESSLTIRLKENKEDATEDEELTLNFSLHTESNQQLADGECYVLEEDNGTPYLYISTIHVEGHTNRPTHENPNKYIGLGQLLVFAAIRFGFQYNLKNAQLIAVPGSEGFYLKMGFHRKAQDYTNKMMNQHSVEKSSKGKLNKNWLKAFRDASCRHNKHVTWPTWETSISNLYPRLRVEISRNWLIIE